MNVKINEDNVSEKLHEANSIEGFYANTGILVTGATDFAMEVSASLRKNDIDEVIECLPHFLASTTSAVKILNIHFNRQSFSKLFQLIAKQWKQLELNGELHVLEETVMHGNKMAQFYNTTLVTFMVLFLLVPLISPILDIIRPLNETRTRQQLLKVNYIFFNDDNYFFYVYLQLFWASGVVVLTIIAADWLYMLIIHHNSGLFAVYEVQKTTTISDYFTDEIILENYMYQKFRNCVIMHNETIRFYKLLNDCSQGSYLIQVGLNMLIISATAVQTMVNLDKPAEAIRSAVFCGASQFHLFLLSLPGQVLLDNCSALAENTCEDYCSLSAGGLYEMNIENFGIVSTSLTVLHIQ
ncbi:hypothetical protein WN51_14285 [Melipona quadrifasciata]|uniref:Odorant receptor n=1 Tax=Melipona quadrifasciata TaxID=166423 RepID=A0A0N0BGQ7_9HYME|nr:hypothetical protein WN51_14285 [Melipona quadrifasciata]